MKLSLTSVLRSSAATLSVDGSSIAIRRTRPTRPTRPTRKASETSETSVPDAPASGVMTTTTTAFPNVA